MNEIKIFLKTSGSLADMYKDFSLFEGSYHNASLSIYVPKVMLSAGEGETDAVKTGLILSAPNGSRTTTDAYYADYVQDETINGTDYAVYTQTVPQAYTQFAGTQRLVVNVVVMDSSGGTNSVKSLTASQTVPFVVLQSARLGEDGSDDPLDPSQVEIIEGQIGDLQKRVSVNEGDIDQLEIDVDSMKDAAGNFEAYIGKQIQFVPSVSDVSQEGVLYGIVSDADANLFDLYVLQDGAPVKIGSANLLMNVTTYYSGVLSTGGWSGNAQTLSIEGVTADDDVTVTPIDEDAAAYVTDGVQATAAVSGGVTFTCVSVPSVAITVVIGITKRQEVPTANGYYTKAQVDEKVAALNEGIAEETAERESADSGLQSSIDALQSDVNGIIEDIANKEHFRGYKSTTAQVQAIENPESGDYAWNAQTGTVWDYNNGAWADTGEPIPDQTVPKSETTPLMDGAASAGTQSAYASGDHRHPTDTTRASVQALADETSARQNADTALGGRIDDIEDGTVKAGAASVADKVANPIKINLNGVEVSYDGSEEETVVISTEGGFAQADVSIAAAAWSGGAVTLTSADDPALSNVAENSLVQFVAADASAQTVVQSNVRITGQGAGSVTFSCDSVPAGAVNGTLVIFN